jgi:hypothetical protein
MQRRLLLVLLLVSGAAATACRGTHPPPQWAWDQTANFATAKTYAWWDAGYPKPHGDSIIDGQFIDRHVRGAVDAKLASKGYQLVPLANASLLIGYLTGDTRVTDEVKDPNYAWLTGYENTMYEKSRQVTIDIRSASNKHLIWRGSITRLEGEDPSQAGREIDHEVSVLLDKFPPPPGAQPNS